MGGSGRPDIVKPKGVADELRRAEERSAKSQVEAEVSGLIASLLAKFNDRDRESVQAHLDAIKSALGKDIDGTVDLVLGGSVAKHTYVDGLSDVDALVVLDSCELSELPPSEARSYLAEKLRDRFPKTPVREGGIAVTVEFSDIDIQLVPVVSCRNKIKIGDPGSGRWSLVDPKAFSDILTRVNVHAGRKVVPVIKVVKSILDKLPEHQRLSGYHVESLAVEIFRDYAGPYATKSMVKQFFQESARLVLEPIRDATGQSVHVDDDLGSSGSLERRVISDSLSRITRRMRNADAAQSLDEWREILE